MHEEPELRFQFFTSPHTVVNFHSLHVCILTDKHLLCSSDKKKQSCFIHQRCTEMPQLSENQRNQAIGMLQAGAVVNGKHFECSHQTIHDLNTRFVITASICNRPRPGQRHVTSQQDDRYIMLTHLCNRIFSDECCVREWDRFGGGNVILWGGIMGNVKTDLVVVQGNLDAQRYVNLLNNNLLPFMQNFGHGLIFQCNNARPHTALITANFMTQNNMNV